ncbi:hypothetical protein [Streptomyces goshikiensis]|uniref:hypothetical protein n=1 Tax=Streptomyces goshikiensis TaxID=1942 RepID=UPI0033A8D5E0
MKLFAIAILALVIICGFLANRTTADIAEPVFLASVTVLVFLLPAAGLVGPYLVAQSESAIELAARQQRDGGVAARARTVERLGEIIRSARWMTIGFPCTLAAVLVSSLAMLHTGLVFKACQPNFELDIDRVLGGVALGLLLGTALAIFPMTRHLLQLDPVRRMYKLLTNVRHQPPAPAQGERPSQPDTPPPPGPCRK